MIEGAGARLFVAVELPRRERAALAKWGAKAAAGDPALRAVRDDALHLTLHFLGTRPPEEVDGLAAAVRECVAPAPLRLSLAGALWLAPRRPHVLSCAVDSPDSAVHSLYTALAAPLTAAAPGWAAESRSLRPHVTVARVRRGARPRVGAEPPAPRGDFVACALTLFRSHLGPRAARYEALERRALTAW